MEVSYDTGLRYFPLGRLGGFIYPDGQILSDGNTSTLHTGFFFIQTGSYWLSGIFSSLLVAVMDYHSIHGLSLAEGSQGVCGGWR